MGDVIRLADRRRVLERRSLGSEHAPAPIEPGGPEPLWREVLGARLHALRHARGERLADVAARAGMSAQYLSEIERGRKDPSSEILAAVAGALGRSVREVVEHAHAPRGPVLLAA